MTGADFGFLILDKPSGVTSHTAVRRAAKILGAKKAGHAGTLDPMASGVLLVGLGTGTRLLEYLVGLPKTYRAIVKFGVSTDSLDRDGKITEEREIPDIGEDKIREALSKFTGRITQIPPAVSAIKSGGVPLYKLARRGEEVEPPPREVEIYGQKLIKWEPPFLEIEADVSSGTYIRSLARDLGEALGTIATLWGLRRLAAGPFSADSAVTLEALAETGERAILPAERMVYALPRVTLEAEPAAKLANGIAVTIEEGDEKTEVAVFTPEGALVATALRESGILRPRKVLPRP